MYELFDQIIGELRSAWRFRWIGLGVAWLVCLGGWYWVVVQPDVYEAQARVFVDSSSELRRLLGSQIVEQDVGARLNFVRQSMLGRVHLEQVARTTGLDARATTPEGQLQLINGLRSTIRIDSAGGSRNTVDNIYQITYRNRDRQMAVRVVDTLLNAFVEDTLGASREDSENARQFLEEQVREYETRLTEAESRLAEFRRANFERLPGTEGGYFQSLQAETEALEQARKDLGLAVSRRDRILQRLRGEAPAAGDFGPTGDDQDNTLAQRIREQEKRLEELMLRYTERHPDVVGVRENLARLRERRADELAALDELSGSGPIASTNPVYQALQISLNEAEVEIATLETSLSDRQGRVARLQALVDEVPEVEAQLARLNRDYDVVQAQYQALLQSLERERLSRGAQQSERVEFRVMDPPVAGFQPAAPDRPRLLAMVLIGGLAVGGGLAFLLAQLRPVFLTADALRDATGFPVLGVVTMTRRAVRMAQRRLAILVFCLSGTSLVVAFAAVYVIEVQGPGMLNLIGRVL